MIVDAEAHYILREDYERLFRGKVDDGELDEKLKEFATPREKAATVDTWIRNMDRCGVDKVLFHAAPYTSSDHVAEFVSKRPDRFAGLAYVDFLEEGAPRELERCVRDLGLRGIGELCPGFPGFPEYDPGDKKFFPIYVKAAELDVPITYDFYYPHPGLGSLPAIAYRFPDLKIVVHHLGRSQVRDLLALMSYRPNVYSIVSGVGGIPRYLFGNLQLKDVLKQFLDVAGPEKLIWGVDNGAPYDFYGPRGFKGLESDPVNRALDELGVNDEHKANILGKNAVRVFGLE